MKACRHSKPRRVAPRMQWCPRCGALRWGSDVVTTAETGRSVWSVRWNAWNRPAALEVTKAQLAGDSALADSEAPRVVRGGR